MTLEALYTRAKAHRDHLDVLHQSMLRQMVEAQELVKLISDLVLAQAQQEAAERKRARLFEKE